MEHLRRLPVDIDSRRRVFAAHRRSSAEGPVLAFLDELRDAFERSTQR